MEQEESKRRQMSLFSRVAKVAPNEERYRLYSQQFDTSKYPEGYWWWQCSEANELIYAEFKRRALQMAASLDARGKPIKYSARTICEVMRWECDLSSSDTTFKLPNNVVPGMARRFMDTYGERYPKFFNLINSLGHTDDRTQKH